MGISFTRSLWVGILAAGAACAQRPVTLTEPPAPLLPESFGAWKTADIPNAPSSPISLANVNKAALEESSPQRSKVATYVSNGKTLQVEAIEFGDRTGAYSAFTLVEKPDMRQGKDLGDIDATGDGAVVFASGATLVLAYPATPSDLPTLKPLLERLPKALGNKGVPPLLPTFLPTQKLVEGSARYALGPETYAAEGGVLPANSLGWEKSAEAITAQYVDRHGKETLTLLLYPTPTIAANYLHGVEAQVKGSGPSFATAQVRREGELVMLANGPLSAEDAQKFLSGIHMHQVLSFDKDVQPVFDTEVHKTYSLLTQIVIFCVVFGSAAILLGLFLGFGRAAVRVMQGKPAAVEPEFLSLHLAPQNKVPEFHHADREANS